MIFKFQNIQQNGLIGISLLTRILKNGKQKKILFDARNIVVNKRLTLQILMFTILVLIGSILTSFLRFLAVSQTWCVSNVSQYERSSLLLSQQNSFCFMRGQEQLLLCHPSPDLQSVSSKIIPQLLLYQNLILMWYPRYFTVHNYYLKRD